MVFILSSSLDLNVNITNHIKESYNNRKAAFSAEHSHCFNIDLYKYL